MASQTSAKKRSFYTPLLLGKRWNVHRLTIIRSIQAGKLHAVRLTNRGHYRIPLAEVERVERGE